MKKAKGISKVFHKGFGSKSTDSPIFLRGPIRFLSFFSKRLSEIDFDLLLIYFLLLGIGLVQVYSSSYIFATERLSDGLFFFRRQLLFGLLSILALIFTMSIPMKWVKKSSFFLWAFAGLSVLAVYVPGLGVRVGGALRWVQLPFGLRLEGAEFLKVFLPLCMAALMTNKFTRLGEWALPIKALIVACPLLVLLKHPDFGSFVIACAVILSILFCFGLAWKYIFSMIAVSFVSFLALIWFVPYRKARLMSFLDPWSDPNGSSFQVIQSMLSFFSGGITGKGLGQGQAKLFFLPEAHTDFTMAVLAEEWGFIGVLLLLSLFGYVVLKGVRISLKVQDFYMKVVAIGITTGFALQVFINVGVNMGLLPTKGLTLPFLSYGGSSLLAMGLSFGLLLNISRYQAKSL